jgi:mono/diheme cytochrome c family protein
VAAFSPGAIQACFHRWPLIAQLRLPGVDAVTIGVASLVLAGIAVAANAQEGSGDLAAGRALAYHVCSPCHAVQPDPHPRMLEIAPDFQAIAGTPGMTATALSAFLLTSHPKMRISFCRERNRPT